MINFENNLELIYLEYTIHKRNKNVGSGLGGNIKYFGFLSSKENQISYDVDNVEFKDNIAIWNPDFVCSFEKNRKEIRTILDEKISASIGDYEYFLSDEPGFKINQELVNKSISKNILDIDVSNFINCDIDLSKLDISSQIILCMRACAKFAIQLDNLENENVKNISKPISEFLLKFKSSVVLLAVRTQIQIERLVSFGLDEDEYLGPILKNINRKI